MNWEEVLKKRRFSSIYFQELKAAILKVVEKMPSGTKFTANDVKEEFLQNLEKPRTSENINYNRGLTHFVRNKADSWLNSRGSQLINSSGLVVEGREKLDFKVRK